MLQRLGAFGDEVASELEEQIAVLASHDVRAIELRSAWGAKVLDLQPEQVQRAAQLLGAAGFAVSAIASPVGKAAIDVDIDSELARLRMAMDVARRLDTQLVRVFSFFIPDGRHSDFRDEVLRRMSLFAREAQANGIVLVHENESYIYGDDAERCRDLIDSVGSPALQVAFDPANFVQIGVRPFDEAWPLLAPHVVHFHVKDAVTVEREGADPYPARAPELSLMASVRPAGEGDGQLAELLAALERQDYRGYLVIEPHLHFLLQDLDAAQRFGVAVAALRKVAGVKG